MKLLTQTFTTLETLLMSVVPASVSLDSRYAFIGAQINPANECESKHWYKGDNRISTAFLKFVKSGIGPRIV